MPGDVTVRLKVTEEVGSVLFVCGVKSVGGGVLYSVKLAGGGGGGEVSCTVCACQRQRGGFPVFDAASLCVLDFRIDFPFLQVSTLR